MCIKLNKMCFCLELFRQQNIRYVDWKLDAIYMDGWIWKYFSVFLKASIHSFSSFLFVMLIAVVETADALQYFCKKL
jgi:hypothetical protein